MQYAQRPLPSPALALPPPRLTGGSGGCLGDRSQPERAHMSRLHGDDHCP